MRTRSENAITGLRINRSNIPSPRGLRVIYGSFSKHTGYDITGRLTQESPSDDDVMATYISFRQTLPNQTDIAEETRLHFHLTPYNPDAWLPHAVYRKFFYHSGGI